MAFSGSSASVATLTGRDTNVADLGASFLAISPTPGTGIIGPVSETFVETAPYFHLYNAGSLTIYPTFLKLHVTVVGTTGTRVQFTQTLDSGANRYTSGGSALTINNTNMASSVVSGAQIRAGALVVAAASTSRRILSHRVYRAVIEVVEDTYCFNWGAPEQQVMSSIITSGTGVVAATHNYPPLAIGPGQQFLITPWSSGIAVGQTFEVEFAYIEK